VPRKREMDKTYGEKLIGLFARLLFSGREHSLTELSEWLGCSKQTVLRLIRDIEGAWSVSVGEIKHGNRSYYRIDKKSWGAVALPLTATEMSLLEMCHAFAQHLLGGELFEEVSRALLKNEAFLAEERKPSPACFAAFTLGTVDYTPYQETIHTLITAMQQQKICRVVYRSLSSGVDKTHYIQPLKLFSRGDTVYVHARKAREPGKPWEEPDYDPLLAVHRIRSIEIDARHFELPEDYDFEEAFQQSFGVIKGKSFKVEVEFCGWAAKYVSERVWSPDQEITPAIEGRIRLVFSASSEPEIVGWILSFGEEAKVLSPDWLAGKIKEKAGLIDGLYS